jgi:hypothetical protein
MKGRSEHAFGPQMAQLISKRRFCLMEALISLTMQPQVEISAIKRWG